ncbi:MAG: hypothetical protein PVG66_04315 [Chromatiales bacterium]|jgi:hypothetical protein
MKAFLINPESQSIDEIDVNGLDNIKQLIGYDTLESDPIGDAGDRLYFDEECFLRGTKGRFQIDKVIPVAGKGVVIGSGGDDDSLQDVRTGLDELRSRIKYL